MFHELGAAAQREVGIDESQAVLVVVGKAMGKRVAEVGGVLESVADKLEDAFGVLVPDGVGELETIDGGSGVPGAGVTV